MLMTMHVVMMQCAHAVHTVSSMQHWKQPGPGWPRARARGTHAAADCSAWLTLCVLAARISARAQPAQPPRSVPNSR